MPLVTFIDIDGKRSAIRTTEGTSLMRTAVDWSIAGIVGECGGNCVCATCHVYVDETWLTKLPPADDEEQIMLDMTHAPRTDRSRLACQIVMTSALDGLVVHLPAGQH
jgi:2Fe-2S ferredoxin